MDKQKSQLFSSKSSIGGSGGATAGIIGPGVQKPNTITITLNDGSTKVVGTGYINGQSSKLSVNTKTGNWDTVKANFQNGSRPSIQSIIQSLRGGKQ